MRRWWRKRRSARGKARREDHSGRGWGPHWRQTQRVRMTRYIRGKMVKDAAYSASSVPSVGRNQEVEVHTVLDVEEGHPREPSEGQEVRLPPFLVQHQGESLDLQTKSET